MKNSTIKILALTLGLSMSLFSCNKKESSNTSSSSSSVLDTSNPETQRFLTLENEVPCLSSGSYIPTTQTGQTFPSTYNVPSQIQILDGQRIRFGVRSHFEGGQTQRSPIEGAAMAQVEGAVTYYGRTQYGDIIAFRKFPQNNFTETHISLCNRGWINPYTQSTDSLQAVDAQGDNQFSIAPQRVAASVLEQTSSSCQTGLILSAEVIVTFQGQSIPLYPAPVNLTNFSNPTSLCSGYLE